MRSQRAAAPHSREQPRQNTARTANTPLLNTHSLLGLQRSIGNRAVGRLIQRAHYSDRIGAAFTAVPSGKLPPTLRQNKYWGADFAVKANFDPDRIGEDGAEEYTTAEYRQYVKGYFKCNGVKQAHTLYDDTPLDESTWNEDGNGRERPYGHRNLPNQFSKYKDNGASGSSFEATDKPSIPVSMGERVDICLDFKGVLVKTDENSTITDETPLAESTWSIKGWCKKRGRAKNPIIETGDL
ncbi:MAG: hypothetical protein OHK0022_19120 [Roseiflexaceae bacterium]